MFLRLGQFIARHWPTLLIVWVVALAGAASFAPPLESVVQTGEFAFLPDDSPSHVAERVFSKAFPTQAQASTIAIIARRPGGKLTPADLEFVDDGLSAAPEDPANLNLPVPATALVEKLRKIARDFTHLSSKETDSTDEASVIPVVSYQDRNVGKMLLAPDERATLILMELPTEFLDSANIPLVSRIESLLFDSVEVKQQLPQGLELYLSGTAVVGRDMLQTAKDSAKATEHLTIVLVILLLIIIYRAPLLALVPLITVFVSVRLTMHLLCLMAEQGWITLFTGVESYVTVLLYGAGVDYCLFLIARFKEEVDKGIDAPVALVDAVGSVGAAIAASAGTVICGIGMMIFAEFGKFRDAGIAISFGLVIVLLASLTLTPALLRSTGLWVFWPLHRQISPTGDVCEESGWVQGLWNRISGQLEHRAFAMWIGSLLFLAPFAIVGVWFYSDLSYGLLTDLPKTARSVVGTEVVREHFADGLTGPTTVVIDAPQLNFRQTGEETDGIDVMARFNRAIVARKKELQLDDVRSVAYPLGGDEGLNETSNPAVYKLTLQRSIASYVGVAPDQEAAHQTRMELVTDADPFSRHSIQQLTTLEAQLHDLWKEVSSAEARIYFLGPTASVRDLKTVTDRDQIRIDSLATAGVFLILVILLRRPAICVYLIVSVLLSYLATLGATYLIFWWIEGPEFAGLDWKVPMFLFTILIAVGEDYNIFLMSRVKEEQALRGPVQGIIHALSCTGRIISSCGIIMAGTFASLAAGSLKGMAQLGMALALGVLLDTFLVRPILVPAYLVLVEQGAFGRWSSWLGQRRNPVNVSGTVATVSEHHPKEIGPTA